AALEALFAAGTVARDTVRFGPGVALSDLALRIAVPLASAEAHPQQPWHDGGALSVRWGEGGFELAVPDAGYGFSGASLPAEPDGYRLGEGIEAFELDDGSRYTLEQVLAQASVLPLAGEYHIGRDTGLHLIAPNYQTIVFDDFIRSSEVQVSRDGADLLLNVGDGSTQGRVAGWYGPSGDTPPTGLSFYFDGALDAAALTAAGLELHGGEGDDLLLGLDGYRDRLFGEGGNDIIYALGGDDEIDVSGGGNDLVEAGPGNDYVYEEGRALVIGGAGDDWIEHYGDGGVIAFNPGDGDDVIYAAGALTLSIGGGVQPGDLALARDGPDVVLDVAGAGSIRLTRQWEDDPAAWPQITLQLFGSVHLYDFDGAMGTEGAFGEALAANKLSDSESEGIGGAIAWQYATTGSTGALSDAQLRSVLADSAFGVAPQPIAL
ncbi:MAG: hypothetical protein ACREUK_02150, partial [Burkholderiales bacterium]